MQPPFSQACENNKRPILEVIKPLLSEIDRAVEIGSGTGQHAVYFAEHMPHLQWQPTDQAEFLDGIRAWIERSGLTNVPDPLELDVRRTWPVTDIPALFSANTVHIMHWPQVVEFFEGIAENLLQDGIFLLYGPFNYHGEYTSDSNARFDQWLKARDPGSGIRDLDDIGKLAEWAGLALQNDYAMPANNRLLYWRRVR